jgi:hypothetical protein
MPITGSTTVRRAVLATASLSLLACVSSHVLVGTQRPPIPPDQVHIYLRPPPQHYEEIAILDTSSKHSFSISAQGKTDAVIRRLKGEAAKLGANGVLLEEVGNQASGSVGTGVGASTSGGHASFGIGLSTSSTTFQKYGTGLAIYVGP